MKKILVVVLAVFICFAVFGQEDNWVIREEKYILDEIGVDAFQSIMIALIETALNDYEYIYYNIQAPYDNDERHSSWSTTIIVEYYKEGNVIFYFASDQTVEIINAVNKNGWKVNGQDFIRMPTEQEREAILQIRKTLGDKADIALVEYEDNTRKLNRLIRLEQARAITRIPEEKREDYWFFISPIE